MKSLREIEEVGWIFYGVVFVLLCPGSIWLSYAFTFETAPTIIRAGCGVFIAAMGAGLIAWAVNELLHRLSIRRQKKRKKAEKKKKKKAK